MAQVTINNNDSGLTVRNALNGMFTEIYSTIIVPIKLAGVNVNTIQAILANTFVNKISMSKTAGNPLVRIGSAPNGEQYFAETLIGGFNEALLDAYFAGNTNLYITVSGGTINMRIDVIPNFY